MKPEQPLLTGILQKPEEQTTGIFNYTITEGLNTVASGTNISTNGNTQIEYTMNNEVGVSKTYTLNITNVVDDCGISEITITNNSDSATLFGLPNTSDITNN